ncbi:MAG: cadherin-like domain-containing protein, partial [Desulfobacteraceae bacterium]|nr:cadherin-like domain-containing protein [Desulfobacteraceae bacterium]MBC2750008.1 cadherin-like domain-containing protein [Desulfobacteraceae bacterium]
LDQAAVQDLDAGDVVTDTITLTASDGTTQDIDITITGTNDGPVIDLDANDSSGSAGTAFETTFTEGSGGVSIADSDITISDVDSSSIESAVITITNVEADDLLIVGSLPAGITAGAYDSATGTITLTGSATLADYQQAIRAIQYDNVGDSIGAARTIEVTVNDGLNNSNTAISTVNITTLPTVSIDDVSVQEPDSGTTTMTFTVSIDQALGSDLTFDYQTVDVSTLAGADYVGIGTTTGTITAGNTSTTITVTVNSDTNVFEGDETFTLDLSNFNQTVNFPSGAHLTGGGIQGIGNIGADNGPPDAVDDAFITAPDTPLVTGDVLTNDILVDNAVYDSHDGTSTQGGTVTYNGDGTFTYTPAAGFTGTDTFTYTVIDDDGETDTATVTIDVSSATVNPPTVSAVPDTSYTENDAATSILAGTTLADVDSTSLSSVVVRIDGYIGSQDVLDYLTAGTSVNASVSISGSTWELTLTNGADIDEYESVLNSLTYENASDNPSASTRAITVEAYDETYNNLFSSDSGNLSVLPVNDAPEVFDNTTYVIANSLDNGLNITVPTDPDTDDSDLVITVTGLPGTIGTVTLADGTPVNIGDTLTQAELAALQFDAGGADGEEAFTYTVFDGDLTTTGTTTINVGSTDPDAGTVYESALPDGTGSDGGSATVTGNLFENDSAAGNSIDSVDFGATTYTPTAGVITVTTALGTLNVYADNTTPGFSAGDYVYELTTADGTGADVTESFTYNFTNGIPLSDTLTITVEDDEPIASDLVESVPESEEQVFNVVLTLDVSTSMNAAVGSTTRLELAKDALVSLSQEYFRQSSQVTVTVLLFANGAHELGTYTTFEDVQTAISGVTDVNTTAYPNDLGAGNLTNSTSYVDATALIENVLSADIAAQDPADDTRNISYFLSDGAVTADGTPVGNGFDDFVNSNAIYSYAVGIGTGLPGDLTDLNYIHNIDSMGEGYGTVDPALIVEDVSQLQSELLSTVPTAFGGNITVDVDGSVDNVLFGADTGYVDSITIDLGGTDYTFTYDGSLVAVPPALAATVEVDGTTITLDADDGFAFGTLTFDFSDGSYTFSAPNGTAPATVSFGFSIVDGDGDTASATATFNIVDDAPEARDDLHSITAGETAEGNVITAMGTDGGPAFGLDYTPFATQGGGVDKIVDNAVVTEFTYKGETISLDLTLTTTTVTPPDPTGISEDVAINSSTNWAATNVALSANAGFDADGAGIDGGRGDARIDDRDGGDALTMSFDTVDLPYGVDNLILTMADFQSNRSDAVMITLYDPSGAVIDTLVYAATNNTSVETIDLTAYTGIGSVDLARAGGQDSQLANVAFDPSPAVPYDVTSLDQTGGDNGGNLTWVYSYDYDLDGNPVFDATVTDSDDGSTFTMRSNGYYSYMPDPSSIPTPVTITESFTDGSADQGITVTSTANGNPVITYNGANGIGVNSNGDTWGDSADSGDNIILTFDPVLYPDGIEETTLSFGYDSGTGSAIFYDSTGAVIDTVALTGNNTQAFTGISGIYSIEITTGADGDYSISQIDFTVVPDPTTLPNTLDPILVDYTLTDTDGQSDTAQLAIYTIDNEITGTVGADSITGGALNDAITGDAGDDVLSGGDGNDSISGGAGEDTLSGNDGNDYLSGGDDADTVYGGAGQDHLDGDAGDDIVDGGTGDDIVLGGTGNDLVFGGAGDDRLEGEEGDDTLSGGSGNDTLVGGDGSDTLDGGAGADIVDGGRGADSIVFDENDTHIDGGTGLDTLLISNEVLDFSALSDGTIENIEKLDLNSADAQSISLSLDDVLDMTDANHVLEVTGGEGDEITFAGVQGPGADWTYNGGGLFTHINGIDQVQIVSTDDPDNHVQMFTDDGTPIES